MKRIINFLTITFFACSLLACSAEKESTTEQKSQAKEVKEIEHFNIIIVPDLSNRINSDLYPKQLADQEIIKTVADVFPECFQKGGRIVHQKDRLSLRLINQRQLPNFSELEEALSIDLGKFDLDQRARIEFIKNRAENSLKDEIEEFKKTTDLIYESVGTKTIGVDIWNFFNQSVDESFLQLTNAASTSSIQDKARTIIILLTDGYIEAGSYGKEYCKENRCYYLSNHILEKFRADHKKSNHSDIAETFRKSNYGIVPASNPHLKDVEVLALEFYDRSKTKGGNSTKYPNDFQINKLFWEDYLKNSGVKKFKIVEAKSFKGDIEKIIKDFVFNK
jgi:hypothetical protein